MASRFELRPCDAKVVRQCMAETGLPHFIVSTCVARGFDTPKKIEDYLSPTIDRCWANPLDIPNLKEIVERLHDAILKKEQICVFGDFDVDGISATATLTRAIRALGGRAYPFIPNRFEEGYGISIDAFKRITEFCDPKVLVSVDCGIANEAEVREILNSGVEVLITDHHEAGDLIPKDVPICDPKHEGSEEDARLAGVGVALKVVQALGSKAGFPKLWTNYTDLATLGTIADMMEMGNQNRALVASGIGKMNTDARPCIKALCEVAGVEPKDLSSTKLSFSLIPRINASGRLGKADVALDLLLTDNADQAKKLAEELEELNKTRKVLESELGDCAEEQAKVKWNGQSCLIVAGEGWHEGVKGIVAAKLIETYRVPTLLFTIGGEEARGSGRSVGEVNLFEAVDAQSDLLIRYGGHKSAVGVTLATKNLPEFERRMISYLDNIDKEHLKKRVLIDSIVSLEELTLKNVELSKRIGPFGQGNPQPVFLAKNARVVEGRAVGASGEHFYCKLEDADAKIPCITFRCENIEELGQDEVDVNAIFSVKNETWRGITSVKAQALNLLTKKESSEIEKLSQDKPLELVDGLLSSGANVVTPQIKPRPVENSNVLEAFEKADRDKREKVRHSYRNLSDEELTERITKALIGDGVPHPSQAQVIENLKSKINTLAVMATGRGKSFIFQFFATYLAITKNKASVFVYPLRALMADQAFSMQKNLSKFEIRVEVLNGNTAQNERERIYAGLKNKTVDIVLTTPEYLKFHSDKIAECNNVGFLVVDEAHHVAEGLTGRKDYLKLGHVLDLLSNPTVLATSATVPENVGAKIKEILKISHEVIDKTPRLNLKINDKRNTDPTKREDYIARIIANRQKTVVYVSTRQQCLDVARRLRLRVPHLAPEIGFYCAGLSSDERSKIEDYFRSGGLEVLVATSAFGEGIDIPNIRHVVLYHMPFSHLEFNQMAGRAGRDGKEAWVHLLFGDQDAKTNQAILNDATPTRDIHAVIYNRLRKMQENSDNSEVVISAKSFSKSMGEFKIKGARHSVSEQGFDCAINVFSELGLIEDELVFLNDENVHKIRVIENAKKVELSDSLRYLEGQIQKEEFENFRQELVSWKGQELTERISHPIF